MSGDTADASTHALTGPVQILIVCHANQCRSPMTQILMSATIKSIYGSAASDLWAVSSAGLDADESGGMHPLVSEVLAEWGLFARIDRSRRVTREIVEASDLVLTADRDQRAQIVRMLPAAVRRTFTLRQFARLCASGREATGMEVRDGADLAKLVMTGRSRVQAVSVEEDRIPDPIGGTVDDFRECAHMIQDCVTKIFGPPRVARRDW